MLRYFLFLIVLFFNADGVRGSDEVYDVKVLEGSQNEQTVNIAIGQRGEEMLPQITEEQKLSLIAPERYATIRQIFSDVREHYKTGVPSFDCAKAKTEVEKMICSDKELGGLDYEMSRLFKYYKFYWSVSSYNASFDEVQNFQNKWLAERNAFKCSPKIENKKECLVQLYKKDIQVFKDAILRSYLRNASWTFRRIEGLPEKFKNKKPDYYSVDFLINEGGEVTNPFIFDLDMSCPIYLKEQGNSNMDYYVKIGIDVCKFVDRKGCGLHGSVYPSYSLIKIDFLQNYCLKNPVGRKSLSEGVNQTIQSFFGPRRLLSDISSNPMIDLKTRYEILQGLVDLGADKSWKNKEGMTAYDVFVDRIGEKDNTSVKYALTPEEDDDVEKIKQLLKP